MISIMRRGLRVGLLTLVAGYVSGCIAEEIDYQQIRKFGDLRVKVGADSPFTGRIVNYPPGQFAIYGDGGGCNVGVKQGLLNGEVICRDKSGALIGKQTYLDGQLHGKRELFDPKHRKLLYVISYQYGKAHGEEKSYSIKTGKLISEARYADGTLVGTQRKWRKDGEELLVDLQWEDGKQTGFEREWHPEGQELLVDLKWVDGKQTGFKNDNFAYATYRDGKQHGLYKQYVPDAFNKILHFTLNFNNGILDGTGQVFDRSGNVVEEVEYGNDQILLVTQFDYDRSGRKVHQVSYIATTPSKTKSKSGLVKQGPEKFWNEKGELTREVRWGMGKKI
jgi:antitoxin component YwqK of YwqJK toxin-antitoxin module